MSFFSRPSLTCQQVVELVTDYLEGALSAADRRRFEDHLSGCDHCTEFLQQFRTTIAVAGRLATEDLSPEMQQQFTTLFRRWKLESR